MGDAGYGFAGFSQGISPYLYNVLLTNYQNKMEVQKQVGLKTLDYGLSNQDPTQIRQGLASLYGVDPGMPKALPVNYGNEMASPGQGLDVASFGLSRARPEIMPSMNERSAAMTSGLPGWAKQGAQGLMREAFRPPVDVSGLESQGYKIGYKIQNNKLVPSSVTPGETPYKKAMDIANLSSKLDKAGPGALAGISKELGVPVETLQSYVKQDGSIDVDGFLEEAKRYNPGVAMDLNSHMNAKGQKYYDAKRAPSKTSANPLFGKNAKTILQGQAEGSDVASQGGLRTGAEQVAGTGGEQFNLVAKKYMELSPKDKEAAFDQLVTHAGFNPQDLSPNDRIQAKNLLEENLKAATVKKTEKAQTKAEKEKEKSQALSIRRIYLDRDKAQKDLNKLVNAGKVHKDEARIEPITLEDNTVIWKLVLPKEENA